MAREMMCCSQAPLIASWGKWGRQPTVSASIIRFLPRLTQPLSLHLSSPLLHLSHRNNVRSSDLPLCPASEAGPSRTSLPNPSLQKSITDLSLQSFRKYSAEAPKAAESAPKPPPSPPKKANLTPVYVAVGLAGAGAGFYRYSTGAAAEPINRPKVFNGEDWIDLKVAGIETLSHNTKKLRFEFDDKEAVGGLPVACQSPTPRPNSAYN